MNMSSNGQAGKRKVRDEVVDDDDDVDKTVYVSFSIRGLDGRELFFKVKQESLLIKVFREYCERVNLKYETIHFLYGPKYVRGERQTPKMLDMENGDEITVVQNQYGGGGWSS